jgi:hypothetical protein
MEGFIKYAGFALVSALLVAAGFFLPHQKVEQPVAGAPGPEYFNVQMFRAGFTAGGNTCFSSSTVASVGTIPNLAPETNCIDYTVNVADVTLTTLASTSAWMPQLRNETKTLWIRNASTTATADIILAGGTGINMKSASSTSGKFTIFGDTGADNYARIDFTRQADTDVNAIVTTFTD